ncbi:MAG: 50S ribosomal protein L27 [Sandarakinorhabdus sp.]|nr:50S ribosomal protein L27 [Sandarakinorhabdus sp.]
MAHKKAGGSSKNGRDSESKRLGVHTLYALATGKVVFHTGKLGRKYVSVEPVVEALAAE